MQTTVCVRVPPPLSPSPPLRGSAHSVCVLRVWSHVFETLEVPSLGFTFLEKILLFGEEIALSLKGGYFSGLSL